MGVDTETHSQTLGRSREHLRRGGWKIVEAIEIETTLRRWSAESTKPGSQGLGETKATGT